MPKTEKQKKVLILHTGGTIGMGIPTPPHDSPLAPDHRFVKTLKKKVPELWRLGDIEIRALANKDSSEILPEDWLHLAGVIGNAVDDYDAFVITHGTDTMVYTGTALSYLMPYPCKPVVLTGSQRPLQEIRTDARRNLINSVAIAASQRICEVSIFFDTVLLRANRAKKVHIEEYHAFDSPNFPRLAEERLKTLFPPLSREKLVRRLRQPPPRRDPCLSEGGAPKEGSGHPHQPGAGGKALARDLRAWPAGACTGGDLVFGHDVRGGAGQGDAARGQ
ncbi:MAG: asparaginase [Deltaproteobacteria bacterium]|nr:asparaginase [Deltaproteobacteria bacterium]